MLIQAIRGQYYNTEHIRTFRMAHNRDGDVVFSGEFSDGSTFHDEVSEGEWERVTTYGDRAPQLVPSPPGYFLLRYWLTQDDKDEADREPVIAWQFDAELGYHGVYTAFEYPSDSRSPQCVLCPNGQVVEFGTCIYDDEAAWIKNKRRDTLEQREKEKLAREAKAKVKADA